MRKTIIFLSSVGLQSYSLPRLSEEHDLVLVIDRLEINNVPRELEQLFKQVIVSDAGSYCGPIITLNVEKAGNALQDVLEKYDVRNVYIVNTSEANTVVAAQLRERFSIQGLMPNEACFFTDKSLMKKAVLEHNLKAPKSIPLSQDYAGISSMLGSSFIAKPIGAAGSYAVELIETQNDLNNYHETYLAEGKQFIAEEFISGTMFHCDFILYDGKPIFKACSEYLYPNLDFKNGKNLSSFPVLDENTQAIIFRFANDCLKALGYQNGIYHLELFMRGSECFFLEVGARIPAALVVKMYQVVYGVNIADLSVAALTHSVKEPIIQQQTGHYFLWAYLAKSEGRISRLSLPEFSSEFEIKWEVKVGEAIENSHSIIDRVGVLTAHSDCLEVARRDFESLRQYSSIEIVR